MNEPLKDTIIKYTEGKLDFKEQIELSEQLADQQNLAAEQIFHEDWQKQLQSDLHSDRDLEPVLDKVHHQIRLSENNPNNGIKWLLSFQRIAAILILPLLLAFAAYYYLQNSQPVSPVAYAEIQCPMGVRTKFQLPDGSTGFLNSGSRLKYPIQFIGDRKVELSGEAFFDVVHNAEMPFHVNTSNLDIKVLGTTFNVIANEDEKTEEIVLQTGKVDVSSKDGKQLAVLAPNEQLTMDTENGTVTKITVEASQYSTWKDGKLVFRNENMQQVARRLSRWYNAEVLIEDQQLEAYAFHATFIDEPLDEVLKLLCLTTPISYKEEKRTRDNEGVFQKRKIILKINKSKINLFR
jgi:transmembrane sensor